jgi:6-pyruvoyltetrahydropterin/6-carboxytetrahydropterin synthase
MDFSAIKEHLCYWLEEEWDHKFLVWEQDPFASSLKELDPDGTVVVNFNPTAENMGQYLIDVVGPKQLAGTNVKLVNVNIEETRKCNVTVGI